MDKRPEKSISPNLENQKVDSTKVTGGTKRSTDEFIEELNESKLPESISKPKVGRPQKTKLRGALKRKHVGGDGKLSST